MEISEVKEYITKIKDSSKFKKLDEFTKMTSLDANKDMYENLEYYVKIYHPKHNSKKFFEPDYESFIEFLKCYMNNEQAKLFRRDDGYVDLEKTAYLVQPGLISKNIGNFIDHYIIMTDGSVYISKLPLYYKGNSGITDTYCLYSPLIASYIAKKLGIECAEINLAKRHDGNSRILSKNFLRENEEIVTYTENMELISENLDKIDEALRLRKFDEKEIEEVKFDYIKQEFLAKLIGLKDQTADNTPLIVETDENENRHVRLAPMFDFDYSFHIAKDAKMFIRKCDNGKADIASLIEQYQDYPRFKEFAQESIKILDIEEIFKQIYEDTKIKKFGEYSNDEQMQEFIKFVNKNIEMAKEALSKAYKENEREGRQ